MIKRRVGLQEMSVSMLSLQGMKTSARVCVCWRACMCACVLPV